MEAVKVQTLIQEDGELHLKGLPVKKWDYVDVIILIPPRTTEEEREAALQRLRERADSMGFKSTGPYPTRDELHERH